MPATTADCAGYYEGIRIYRQGQICAGLFSQALPENRYHQMARAILLGRLFLTSFSQGVNSFVKPLMQGNTVKTNPVCKMHIHVTPLS
jgi:hypothetical protein